MCICHVCTFISKGASLQLALKLTHKLKDVLTCTVKFLEQTVLQSATRVVTSDRSHSAGDLHPLTSTFYLFRKTGPS